MRSVPFRRFIRRKPAYTSDATRRDRALAQRLHSTFEEAAPMKEVQNVHFYVLNGIVTVLGHVAEDADREFFLSLVEELPGVEKVVDNLHADLPPMEHVGG